MTLETPLGRGSSHVRQRGNVVTRPAGPWTATVHALLKHLLRRGLLVPEPYGVEGDREVLRFVLGDVPSYPYGPDVWTDASLIAAARLLRSVHDATADFAFPSERWQLPAHEPREVICHNDMAPYNTVFREGVPVGAIDWDTSSPGPRLRDVGYLAFRWVPLQAIGHGNGPEDEGERLRRLRLLLAEYGSDAPVADVVAMALTRVRELRAYTAERLAGGNEMVRPHLPRYDADIAYLEGDPLS